MVSVAKRFANIPLSDQFHGHFEKPYAVVHHAELHLALLEACQQSGFVELRTHDEICNFNQTTFVISAKLGDGSQIEGTALIGADGLNSQICEVVIADGPPRNSDRTTYRSVIRAD